MGAAENALLGCAMINPECFPVVREYVGTVDVFTNPNNASLFSAMDSVYCQHGRLDEAVLIDRLVGSKDPLCHYASTLVNATPTSHNVRLYGEEVFKAHQRRVVAQDAKYLAEYAMSPKVSDEVLEQRVSRIVEVVAASVNDDTVKPMSEMAYDAAESLISRIDNKGMSGLKTGIGGYDRLTHGLGSGMHVVAACTSVGKTAFSLNVAKSVCEHGGSVLFISLEMGASQITERMLMMVGGIDASRLDSGFLGRAEAKKIPEAARKLSNMDFVVVKPASLTPSKMRAVVANNCITRKPSLVIIDYLQLMTGEAGKDGRQVEVASCSRAVKMVSGEFDIPIMALSQLNRDAAEGVPKLHHIRESGAIEQDADTVLMLHRTEEEPSVLFAALRKGRACSVGAFSLHYNKHTQIICDVDDKQKQPVESESIEDTYGDESDEF